MNRLCYLVHFMLSGHTSGVVHHKFFPGFDLSPMELMKVFQENNGRFFRPTDCIGWSMFYLKEKDWLWHKVDIPPDCSGRLN